MANRTRRDFFSSMVDGLHGTALATLLGADLFSAAPARANEPAIYDLKPKAPQFPARAKSVIHLFMNGGPSQMDLFDPKPALKRLAGTAPSRELSFAISERQGGGHALSLALRVQEGREVRHGNLRHAAPSARLRRRHRAHPLHVWRACQPRAGAVPDAHRPYHRQPAFHGRLGGVRPGHGESEPARPTSCSTTPRVCRSMASPTGSPPGCRRIYQGTRFRAEGTPVLNLEPRAEVPTPLVEAERNLLRKLDEAHRKERPYQPELDARISSYELSARMQLAASDALDVNKESEATREAYGLNDPLTGVVRQALSDGAASGGARRALRAAIYRKPDLRHPRRPAGGPAIRLRQDRQARGRAHQGSEAARTPGFHADRLGRGIRAPADLPG